MKKAAKIVAIVSLVLDYMILIGLIVFALYLFLNIDVIVNNNVSNAMGASSSSSAMASGSMSSGGDEAVGKAIGGAVVAFGSAIAVMMVMVFSFLGAALMIFPIITMATCSHYSRFCFNIYKINLWSLIDILFHISNY